ncbi:hypothetical protein Ancab_034557 [Ancistrocladus abbreviatus]
MCSSCFAAAESLVFQLANNKKQVDANKSTANPLRGLANVVKWLKERKEMEEENEKALNDRLSFLLGSLEAAFGDQVRTDIQVKPGCKGPPIPAHRALLAAKSNIFKDMLELDGRKTAPTDTVTFRELNHEELQSFMEFLFRGSLPMDKVEKHVYTLAIAAHKYEIPFLHKFCERRMLGSLNSANALDVLVIADACSNQSLKDTALKYIVRNMKDIVLSAKFGVFALKSPHLSVEITRASFKDVENH